MVFRSRSGPSNESRPNLKGSNQASVPSLREINLGSQQTALKITSKVPPRFHSIEYKPSEQIQYQTFLEALSAVLAVSFSLWAFNFFHLFLRPGDSKLTLYLGPKQEKHNWVDKQWTRLRDKG